MQIIPHSRLSELEIYGRGRQSVVEQARQVILINSEI